MKTIGLLGGTSWPSTMDYYAHFNRIANETFGGHHSAKLKLLSIDYHPIKSLYNEPNGWDRIPSLLLKEINQLIDMNPDCIIICNNLLHKAVDILEKQGHLPNDISIIHIADATGQAAIDQKHKNVLLLGTKVLMEDGFYADRLAKKFNLNVDIPYEQDKNLIQNLQSEIATGNLSDDIKEQFVELLQRYKQYDAVILACTELPLAISEDQSPIPIINPTYEQCLRGTAFAFV